MGGQAKDYEKLFFVCQGRTRGGKIPQKLLNTKTLFCSGMTLGRTKVHRGRMGEDKSQTKCDLLSTKDLFCSGRTLGRTKGLRGGHLCTMGLLYIFSHIKNHLTKYFTITLGGNLFYFDQLRTSESTFRCV